MQKSWRWRRNTTWSILLALLALVGAGCAPATNPTPQPSELPASPTAAPSPSPPATLVLTVWHSWGAEEEQVFRDIIASYQALHPGVAIRLQQVPVERIVDEYEEAVLSGAGPDLLAGRSDWIGRLGQQQIIVPLGEIMPHAYWEGFYPFALTGVESNGYRYAVPYACETVALYYNREYVGEPPTTTTQLLDLAATWTSPEQAGLAFPLTFYNTVGYLYAFGGGLLDEAGRPTVDTGEVRVWLSWLQWVRGSPGVVAADSYGQADTLFKAGAVAMLVNGSWVLSDYLDALGHDRLGVAPLPMLDETRAWPAPYVGYQVLMVNPVRLVEHPQPVLDLVQYLGGPEAQKELAVGVNALPTWQHIDLANAPLLAAFVQQAELGRPRPVSSREQLLWDPLDTLLYNVTAGQESLDLALERTQQQVENLLGTGEEP
jgi:maltose-binding protein MalE